MKSRTVRIDERLTRRGSDERGLPDRTETQKAGQRIQAPEKAHDGAVPSTVEAASSWKVYQGMI